MRRVILASGSPRRRELLSQTGLNFEVIPGDIDEAAVIAALAGEMSEAEPESGAEPESEGKIFRAEPGSEVEAPGVKPGSGGKMSEAEPESGAEPESEGKIFGAEPGPEVEAPGERPEPEGQEKAQKSACIPAGNTDGRLFASRVVEALSRAKAESAAAQIAEGIVIGSDTIVWNGRILGKPKDRAEAYAMIQALQGRTHSVFTGVTVLVKREAAVTAMGEGMSAGGDVSAGKDASAASVSADRDASAASISAGRGTSAASVSADRGTLSGGASESLLRRHTFACETKVRVYPMTDAEIEQYLDAGEYADKAGAYGIQGKFGLWVQAIEGDYNNVVGLPLSALWQILKSYV